VKLARHADPHALAAAAADGIAELAARALAGRGRFHLALSGGSTPRATYALLAARAAEVELARWDLWFGDERCVAPDDPRSNHGMAASTGLLASVPDGRVHRMRGESADPAAEAARYERELTAALGDEPALDLVLLGLGEDGHTASLFPGDAALRAPGWVTAARAPVEPRGRLTLTLRALAGARTLLFLVSGAAKGPALRAVLGPGDGPPPPARLASEAHPDVRWLLDAAAAEELPG